jgi:hypothetical protein
VLQIDDPVKVRGFVGPFGQAPSDFSARTIVTTADVRAVMKVDWQPPTSGAFSTISADGLILNLEGAGHFHHLVRGWVVTDLTDLSQAPSVVPQSDGRGTFVIRTQGIAQVFLEFEPFAEALADSIADGLLVSKFNAVGEYDDIAAALTVGVVELFLNPTQD